MTDLRQGHTPRLFYWGNRQKVRGSPLASLQVYSSKAFLKRSECSRLNFAKCTSNVNNNLTPENQSGAKTAGSGNVDGHRELVYEILAQTSVLRRPDCTDDLWRPIHRHANSLVSNSQPHSIDADESATVPSHCYPGDNASDNVSAQDISNLSGQSTVINQPRFGTALLDLAAAEGRSPYDYLQLLAVPFPFQPFTSARIPGQTDSMVATDVDFKNSNLFPLTVHHKKPGTARLKDCNNYFLRNSFANPTQVTPRQPSIITVEMTANAKIFLETFYDALFATPITARSLRRRSVNAGVIRRGVSERRRQKAIAEWAASESAHLRRVRAQKSKSRSTATPSMTSTAGFEVIRVLGKGSFGVVKLVREKESCMINHVSLSRSLDCPSLRTGIVSMKSKQVGPTLSAIHRESVQQQKGIGTHLYAMKVIRKSSMLKNCQEAHLRTERDCLVASRASRWVVPLVASFQDTKNLYLVMEFMIGGDFLGLLFRKGVLKEKHARWYLAEIVLCVEELHRNGWIHRDIKPDNFLIACTGHLKISDFGLAFSGHWAHDQKFFKRHRETLMQRLGITARGDSIDRLTAQYHNYDNTLKFADRLQATRKSSQSLASHGPDQHESILQWRSREGQRKFARSIVGTSQYMAPEIVSSSFSMYYGW